MTRLSEGIKKPWLKSILEGNKNIINDYDFLVQEIEKGDPVNPCMDDYKEKLNMMEVLTSSN